jgi:hypothetical protein
MRKLTELLRVKLADAESVAWRNYTISVDYVG